VAAAAVEMVAQTTPRVMVVLAVQVEEVKVVENKAM
tara:strand:+ start:294 stop:401 length:108 start_codon:yes stop_codon:yes gene_type:complete